MIASLASAVAISGLLGAAESPLSWPRFPHDEETRREPVLALLYSTGNAAQTLSLARIGYPDRILFRLHREHPRLRVVLVSTPANRYVNPRPLAEFPEAAATLKALAMEPRFDWIEIANQGGTHSPPGDSDLNHHEFSGSQSGCNLDHSVFGTAAYGAERMQAIRDAYRSAGIPDERIGLIRFPGYQRSPAALEAAARAGFIALLGSRDPLRPGAETWLALPGGGEILQIPDTWFVRAFARAPDLESGIESGRIPRGEIEDRPEFAEAVSEGLDLVERAAGTGGILHLTDSWSETFEIVGGTYPRYLILDAVLKRAERTYQGRIWHPTGRDLALWLEVLRAAGLSWRENRSGGRIDVTPPPAWSKRPIAGLDRVTLRLRLPPGWRAIRDARIREENGPWRELGPAEHWVDGGSLVLAFPLHGPVSLRVRPAGKDVQRSRIR